ncbi:MAG TPA: YceI family protein, partial [Planctomycetota bacterium]
VDNVHSAVLFRTLHVGIAEAHGRFNRISDKSLIVLDPDPAKCSVLLVVEADSVDTASENRDKHLRSGDFFNAKEFPEIVFESQEVRGQDGAWEVVGELSFHGVTKGVTAKARRVGQGEFQGKQKVGLVAELEIDMQDFGIEMVKKNPGAVGPKVALTISLECEKK